MTERYDVVILGGGMVGASLACALAGALGPERRIAVVERFAPAATTAGQPSFDARATALSAGSRGIFERIGVWSELADHAEPIDTIHVCDRGRPGSVLMDAAAEGLDALGYVIENRRLGQVLQAQLARAGQIDWLCPAAVERLAMTAHGPRAALLHDGVAVTVDADLAVIADGAGSPLARALGIGYREVDYGGVALIANVTTTEAHRGRAFERFSARGPMALLPLTDCGGTRGHRSELVWTLSAADGERMQGAGEGEFRAAVQHRFGNSLGRFESVGARHCYPLRSVVANEQTRAGIAVLGNAAHLLHPVAGQGFNLALRDVARLTAALVGAHRTGRSLGDAAVLANYARAQHPDQRRTELFCDGLLRLFGSSQPLLGAARDLGLALFDSQAALKSRLVAVMAGLADAEATW